MDIVMHNTIDNHSWLLCHNVHYGSQKYDVIIHDWDAETDIWWATTMSHFTIVTSLWNLWCTSVWDNNMWLWCHYAHYEVQHYYDAIIHGCDVTRDRTMHMSMTSFFTIVKSKWILCCIPLWGHSSWLWCHNGHYDV